LITVRIISTIHVV